MRRLADDRLLRNPGRRRTLMRKMMRRDPKAVKKSNLSPRTYLLQLYAECLNVINGRFGRDEDPLDRPCPVQAWKLAWCSRARWDRQPGARESVGPSDAATGLNGFGPRLARSNISRYERTGSVARGAVLGALLPALL